MEHKDNPDAKWEEELAAAGMPPELEPLPEELSGDALEVLDPASASERAALARTEEAGDTIWGKRIS